MYVQMIQFPIPVAVNMICQAMFSTLCYVEVDTSNIKSPPIFSRHSSENYYKVDFEVVFSFGLTELKAYVSWKENVSPIPPGCLCFFNNLLSFIVGC